MNNFILPTFVALCGGLYQRVSARRRNSNALALELRHSWTNESIFREALWKCPQMADCNKTIRHTISVWAFIRIISIFTANHLIYNSD